MKKHTVIMEEPKMEDMEIFERSCCLFVLRYLYAHPGKNKTEIMSTEGKSLNTKGRRIDELLHERLLDVDPGERRELIYSLSEYGARIAPHIEAIYEILKERDQYMNEDGSIYIDPEAMERFNEQKDQWKSE